MLEYFQGKENATMFHNCWVLLATFLVSNFAQAGRKKILGGSLIGQSAMRLTYPFMARLVMDGDKRCGGSVISDR